MSEISKEEIQAITRLETLMDTVMKTLQEISAEQKELRRENAEIKSDVRQLRSDIKNKDEARSKNTTAFSKLFSNVYLRIIAMLGGFGASLEIVYQALEKVHHLVR